MAAPPPHAGPLPPPAPPPPVSSPPGPPGPTGDGAPPGPAGGARGRERADARTVAALAGPLLATPAALALADREGTVAGVPVVLVYIFAVWLAGIVITALLARGDG